MIVSQTREHPEEKDVIRFATWCVNPQNCARWDYLRRREKVEFTEEQDIGKNNSGNA